ncbi:serine/threonine protein kinase [Sorangium sp. KYC3313]|uniref:serine/threonine protein kinase n=1 Tax=Sorangium sp. KYC3313 TaxID=3449740 RepID=UPI003F8877F0
MNPPIVFHIRTIGPLGEGGLGTVEEVEIISDNGPYPRGARLALKKLGPKWADDPGAQARFEREIELLKTMDHPGIVKCVGESLPGYERTYTMPKYPGSLRKLLNEHNGPIALSWVVNFAMSVTSALAYAHQHNFIHRDIKPENILMDSSNNPVIADWGLGQFIHQHSKVLDLKTKGPVGTFYYCSMEQWNTGRCEAPGDVYSLGIVLAEMVLGRRRPIAPPFSGIQQDVLSGHTTQERRFNDLIKKMTHFDASKRHQTMTDVAAALLFCA